MTVESGVLQATSGSSFGTGGILLEGGEVAVGGAFGSRNVTFAAGGTSFTGTGSFTLAGGSLIYQASGAIAAAHGTTLTVQDGLTIADGATLTFGGGANDGAIVLDYQSENFDGKSYALDVHTGSVLLDDPIAGSLFDGAQTLAIDKGATLDLGSTSIAPAAFSGSGTLTASGGFAGIVVHDGSFNGAISGFLTVAVLGDFKLGGVGSFGTLEIVGDGATATIDRKASEAVTMTDDPGAILVLSKSAKLTGAISGFGASDQIDLKRVAFHASDTVTYNATSHQLTVSDGAHSVSLTVSGAYTAANFGLFDDGKGSALIGYQASSAAPVAPAGAFTHAASAAFAPAITHGLMPDVLWGIDHHAVAHFAPIV